MKKLTKYIRVFCISMQRNKNNLKIARLRSETQSNNWLFWDIFTRRTGFTKISMGIVLMIMVINSSYSQPRLRPAQWANEVIGTELDNFHQVDKGVYRSKQPDDETFAMLENMGIKEVLNLRRHHSDTDEAEGTDLKLHHIKINAGSITEDQLIEALRIIKNREGPIVFHCWHGSDRTGAVAAAYRIIFNNWSKADAIDELVNGDYGYHESIYGNIKELINNLDVEHVKFHLGH